MDFIYKKNFIIGPFILYDVKRTILLYLIGVFLFFLHFLLSEVTLNFGKSFEVIIILDFLFLGIFDFFAFGTETGNHHLYERDLVKM